MKKLLIVLAISLVMVACEKEEKEIDPKTLSVEDSYYEIDPEELIGTYWTIGGMRYEAFDANGKHFASSYEDVISGTLIRSIIRFDENTVYILRVREKNRGLAAAWYEILDYSVEGNKITFSDKSGAEYTMFNGDVLLKQTKSFTAEQDFKNSNDVEIKKGSLVKVYSVIGKTSEEKYKQRLEQIKWNNLEIVEGDGEIWL